MHTYIYIYIYIVIYVYTHISVLVQEHVHADGDEGRDVLVVLVRGEEVLEVALLVLGVAEAEDVLEVRALRPAPINQKEVLIIKVSSNVVGL